MAVTLNTQHSVGCLWHSETFEADNARQLDLTLRQNQPIKSRETS